MNEKKVIQINIPRPNIQLLTIRIKGTAPLIFHKWSEKAKKMMLDKQMKVANKGREIRNPEQEYKDSYYYNSENKISIPAISIKQAMVGAARNIEGVTMTLLRGAIFVVGDKDGLIPLTYKEERMRTDTVTVGMRGADLRFRGEVIDWETKFVIKYNADVLSAAQVINLLAIAGFACGIGEWRPEKNGDKGTFEVVSE